MNIEIEKLSSNELVALVKVLLTKVEEQAGEIAELKRQLNQTSRNSSKPPSSDWQAVSIPRQKTGRQQGGQPGHKGNFLKIERESDEIVKLKPENCQKCGVPMSGQSGTVLESRRKIDVEIVTLITEYEQVEVVCPCCGNENRGEFPADVDSHISYGEGVQSFGVLLTNYANVSYGKTEKIMSDVLGVPLSTGTLVNHVNEFAEKSEGVLAEIAEHVKSGKIGHFDETSVRVNGANYWLHTAGNAGATYSTVHPKRGKEGTDGNGVLKEFGGVAVHDCLPQYFGYDNCRHAVCNAHLLRELQGVIDNAKQAWAARMQELLREMKTSVDECKAIGGTALPEAALKGFTEKYERILKLGEWETPRDLARKKQSKPRNLLDRFIAYRAEVTRFAHDFHVPFTNNQAERDIRNAKVKMKVSGGFRSDKGAKNFAKISSVVGAATKQGASAFKTVQGIFARSLDSLFSKPQPLL